MISYRDMTFCSQEKCVNTDCLRNPTDWDQQEADRLGLEMSFADFIETEECPGYEGPDE